jgi:hypothetical protein
MEEPRRSLRKFEEPGGAEMETTATVISRRTPRRPASA